jgi:hypothetical protein
MSVCACVCACVCVCVCVCVMLSGHVLVISNRVVQRLAGTTPLTHSDDVYVHVYTYTRIHAYMCVSLYAHVLTLDIWLRACVRACVRAFVCVCRSHCG